MVKFVPPDFERVKGDEGRVAACEGRCDAALEDCVNESVQSGMDTCEVNYQNCTNECDRFTEGESF